MYNYFEISNNIYINVELFLHIVTFYSMQFILIKNKGILFLLHCFYNPDKVHFRRITLLIISITIFNILLKVQMLKAGNLLY